MRAGTLHYPYTSATHGLLSNGKNNAFFLTGNYISNKSAVKHSRKKHPNLTESDFCLIPMIIAAADEITLGKHPDTVVYRKVLDKDYYYVECTRTGRKRLAMKTFYKTKTAPKKDAVL